jgi:Uma2 family endonuclease
MAPRDAASYRVGMDASVAPVAEPKRKATYDDVLAAPEHQVAEILDGELFLSPRPASPHALAAIRLSSALAGAFDQDPGEPVRPGGWWLLSEPELHFEQDVLVPDLAAWRRERMPRIPSVPWFDLAPDWLCEVLSPSTARIDRTRKLAIYGRAGVPAVWFVDPLARTLEALALDGRRWILDQSHGGSDVVRAAPFAALDLPLARLWID